MKRLVRTPYDDLLPFIELLFPKLVAACAQSMGRYKAEDIIKCIKADSMQIWLAFEDEKLDGLILTQIIEYPQSMALRFLCLTGVGVDGWQEFMSVIQEWLPFVKQIEDWARNLGCKLSQIECPAAWELYMRDYGYVRTHVLLDRELV